MNRRQVLRVAVGFAGIALFAQSLHIVGLERIRDGVGRVGWGFAAILMLSGARELARTLAWTRTVEGPAPLRFAQAFRARLVGEALNTLLPMGMMVGEPIKASHVGTDIPFATAFTALAVEFAFYCGSLALLFGAGLLAFIGLNKVPIDDTPVMSFGLISGGLIAVILLTAVGWTRGIGKEHAEVVEGGGSQGAITQALSGLRRLRVLVFGFVSRHPEQVRAIVACEIAYQLLAVAEVYVALVLISPLRPTVASAVVLETVSRAITMLFKIVPMRIGVDEIGSSLFAARLDLTGATGLTLALVRKLRLLFWSAVGLAILLPRSSLVTPAVRALVSRLFMGAQPTPGSFAARRPARFGNPLSIQRIE